VPRKSVETTDHHYVVFKFTSRSDADAFREMVSADYEGVCGEHEVRSGYSVRPKHETRCGQLMLEAMLPGRVYHFEDVAAMVDRYSPATVKNYLVAMVHEYSKPHDTTPSVRADDIVEAPVDGDLARLEQGETCGCGCGDEG
jgi:hypothetical protein